MKQTFNIPGGCKVVTVEQIGNQLITSFEPEKYVPKKGDLVKVTYDDGYIYFFEISEVNGFQVRSENMIISPEGVRFCGEFYYDYDSIEKLTPEEFQAEFEKLGYVYDFETHTVSKKRWRAEDGGYYFYVDFEYDVLSFQDSRDSQDDRLFEYGNYFQAQSDAEKFAEIIKKEAINFHKNNK